LIGTVRWVLGLRGGGESAGSGTEELLEGIDCE
jgi:hypothetical protein